MSNPLGVSPDELRARAEYLADTSAHMKQVLASLRETLAASGAAWGDDEAGKQFANGPGGYLAQVNFVHRNIDAKTDLLDGYSDAMRRTANTLEQQDGGVGGGGGRSGGSNGFAASEHAELPAATLSPVPAVGGPAAGDLKKSGEHAALRPELPAAPLSPRVRSVPPVGGRGPVDLTQTGGSGPASVGAQGESNPFGGPLDPPIPTASGSRPDDLAPSVGNVEGSVPFVGGSSAPFQSMPALGGAGSVDLVQSGGQGQLLGMLGQLAPSLISAGSEVAGEIPGMVQQNQQPPTGGPIGDPPPPATPDGDPSAGDG